MSTRASYSCLQLFAIQECNHKRRHAAVAAPYYDRTLYRPAIASAGWKWSRVTLPAMRYLQSFLTRDIAT